MARFTLASLLLLPLVALAADPLPEGAELRLGSPPSFNVDYSAAFSPDGKRVATGGANPPVAVWDVATGKQLHTHDRPGSVFQLAWTKDGKLVGNVFYGFDGFFMCEWADANDRGPDQKRMTELYNAARNGQEGPRFMKTALSPEGRWSAAVFGVKDNERTVAVFPFTANMPSKLVKPELTLALPGCEFVGFSGDGSTLFAVQPHLNRSGRVTAYDLTAKKPQEPAWVLDTPPEEQKFIEQDGKKLPAQGKGWPSGVLSADGKRVVVEYPYGTFEVWDGPTGKKAHEWSVPWYILPGSGEGVLLAVSPDGKRLAVSSREKSGLVGGMVYDLDTGKEAAKLAAVPCGSRGALKYSTDGKRLYRSDQVWDAETGKDASTRTGHRGTARSVIVSGDGKVIVTSGDDLTARGWDAKTGKELWRADFPIPVTLRRVTGDTAVAGDWMGWMPLAEPLLTLSTGKLSPLPGDMGKEKQAKIVSGYRTVRDHLLAISPDGKTAVTFDRSTPALQSWEWPTGKLLSVTALDPPDKMRLDWVQGEVSDTKEFTGWFRYAEAEPRQERRTTRSGTAHVERWDLTTGKRADRFVQPITSVSNGKRRFLLHDDLRVTDEAGKEVCQLPKESRSTSRAFFTQAATLSPDGTTLAVPAEGEGGNSVIRVFDLNTGDEIRVRTVGGSRTLGMIAYLPDGRLVSAGESVFVWKATGK